MVTPAAIMARLEMALRAAGVPIERVGGEQGALQIDYRPEATAEHRATADAIVAAFDWTQATETPEDRAEREALIAAQAFLDSPAPTTMQAAAGDIQKLKRVCKWLFRRALRSG